VPKGVVADDDGVWEIDARVLMSGTVKCAGGGKEVAAGECVRPGEWGEMFPT